MFHRRLHPPQKANFKVSLLRYAFETYFQCQVVVKLPGSFRLTAGNRHLHRYCIFTERVPETVLWSLRHSCASELHCVISFYKEYQTISSSQRFLHFCFRIFSFSPWIHFKRKTHYFIQSVFFPVHISLHQETNLLE